MDIKSEIKYLNILVTLLVIHDLVPMVRAITHGLLFAVLKFILYFITNVV